MAAPSISVYANPKANVAITTFPEYVLDEAGQIASAQVAKNVGVDHFYEFFQWGALETSTGNYTNADLFIGRMTAKSGNLPLWLGIAVVDTDGLKHVPSDLMAVAWDNAAMITAFQNFLTHLQGLLTGRELRVLFIGNEANNYFNTDATQIAKFATFFAAARTKARTLFDNAILKVTTTFTFAAIAAGPWSIYSSITANTDLESFTYYFRSGTDFVTIDLPAMKTAANGPWVLQEVGFTSNASPWPSSEAIQKAFLSIMLAAVTLEPTFVGGTWFQMSDYSTAVFTSAGYTTPELEFYGQDGLFTTAGVEKSGWRALAEYLCGARHPILGGGYY